MYEDGMIKTNIVIDWLINATTISLRKTFVI